MSVKTEKITHRQTKAIAALISNRTVEDAANSAGVSQRTLHRWLNLPLFANALVAAEVSVIESAVRTLIVDMTRNHSIIRKIRDDENISPSVRLRAAQTLDSSTLRWRELWNLEQRLNRLEEISLWVQKGKKD